MGKAIQVVVVKVYRYVPNLSELNYSENGITNLEEALKFDRADYESGATGIEEIIGFPRTTGAVWSVVDE